MTGWPKVKGRRKSAKGAERFDARRLRNRSEYSDVLERIRNVLKRSGEINSRKREVSGGSISRSERPYHLILRRKHLGAPKGFLVNISRFGQPQVGLVFTCEIAAKRKSLQCFEAHLKPAKRRHRHNGRGLAASYDTTPNFQRS